MRTAVSAPWAPPSCTIPGASAVGLETKFSVMTETKASASAIVEHHPKDALHTPVGAPCSSTSTPSPHTFPAA